MTGIFDSHAHYDDERFDPDREEVLEAIHRGGVEWIMNIGSDLPTSRMSVELAESHDYIYGAVGVHPHGAAEVPPDYLDQLRQLSRYPKVKAIGEIGLDYYYDREWEAAQKRVFEEQLELAKELELPVIIHDRDAHQDTMELLRKHRPRGIVHCYSGSAEMALEILRLGMYIGFTGVVTFKNARRALEAAAVVPLDRLLVETDCPYMAPEPWRGKRCDSSMLTQVLRRLAEVKGVSPEELARITAENARRVYGIAE